MNAVSTMPSVCAANTSPPGDIALIKSPAAGLSSSLFALFPLLLDNFLQPEAGQPEDTGKRQEHADQLLSLAAPASLPVPIPVPPGQALASLPAPLSGAPQPVDDLAPVENQSLTEPPSAINGEKPIAVASVPAPARLLRSGVSEARLIRFDPAMAAPPDFDSPGLAAEALPVLSAAPESARRDDPGGLPIPVARLPVAPASVPVAPPTSGAELVPGSAPATTATPAPPSGRQTHSAVPLAETPSAMPAVPSVPPEPSAATQLPSAGPSAGELAAERPANRAPKPAGCQPLPRLAGSAAPPAAEGPGMPAPAGAKVELAFAARLTPLERDAAPHPPVAVPAKPAAPVPGGTPPVPPVEQAGTEAHAARADAQAPGVPMPAPRTAGRALADSEPVRPDNPAPLHHASEPGAELSSAIRGSEVVVAREGRAAPAAELHRPASSAPSEPRPSSPAPARDIRLQVSGGEQRVDVRLTERGGAVQVAVRTPDSRLAEALRSDLPVLSARLEQSGFRAETWHPAALRTEHYGFTPETPSSGSAPQGREGERQGSPQDQQPPPRRTPVADRKTGSDSPPQEFSWLLSSLR